MCGGGWNVKSPCLLCLAGRCSLMRDGRSGVVPLVKKLVHLTRSDLAIVLNVCRLRLSSSAPELIVPARWCPLPTRRALPQLLPVQSSEFWRW
jgi:hypothetical protein